ncbi:lysine transporter LysE [Jannaschia pagri]|uniref:Lysine transporter LysE n=1 Tax=Jannaschia pagri TaxID=2829797 RepID=A0ABQ4NQF8_9RHOB|nr:MULTISPECIES: LysE family translocator [unclassified Jannaschia]GIT92814.1 lysine transporter LysE [Jannaschia sp. AI_61]GIT96649.1 lysine transporter LysE [Jannaschia sp. AI_62]
MDPTLFFSFLLATLAIAATPGPSVALATSQALRGGRRAMYWAVAGDALGTMVHIAVAVAGLRVLIGLADQVLPALQLAGGAYILWLAWRAWHDTGESLPHDHDRRAFLSGFFACVTNPKAIVFFVALFPGFIAPDLNVVAQSLVYGAVFIAVDATSILAYALLTVRAVRSPLAARIPIHRISACGLAGVGALLIWKGWRDLPR